MISAWCGSCGAGLEDANRSQREPCPICGSIQRNWSATVTMHAEAMLTASASFSAATLQLVATASDLLMQAVILPGARTLEGTLIEAVTIPWFDIIKLLGDDPNIAYQIPAHRWEEIIAGAYHKAGFEEVTLTPRSGDHGRDVIAVKKGLGSVRVIDQVKAYKPGHLVTADDVRALLGVLPGDGASKGFLTTTSDFAPRLRTDPLIAPFIPSRLGLIDGRTLLARLEELAAKWR
jgi:restriction system protein